MASETRVGFEDGDAATIAPRPVRRVGGTGITSLNITPMIDVVFLLLIYFVLTVSFGAREGSFAADTPRRETGLAPVHADPFELPRRPMVIVVRSFGDEEGAYAISSDEPLLGEIPGAPELRRRLAEARAGKIPEDQMFLIRAAGDARWEHALAVFGAIREAGFVNVRFTSPARNAESAR